MRTITQLSIHNVGGTAFDPYLSTLNWGWQEIDRRHQAMWNFRSSLEKYGGYNLYLEKNGFWTQFRALGEETAAVKGMNKEVLSICLAGNFNLGPNGQPIDVPTFAQRTALRNLIIAITEQNFQAYGLVVAPDIKIEILNVRPHRFYSLTQCYGTSLTDGWISEVLGDYFKQRLSLWQKLLELKLQLLELLQKQKIRLGWVSAYPDSCFEKDQRD